MAPGLLAAHGAALVSFSLLRGLGWLGLHELDVDAVEVALEG